MKLYNSVITTLILFLSWNTLLAQQQPLYTQFMYNKVVINPGYAGSLDALSATLLHRSQWIGFEGAPTVQALSVHGSLKSQNIALGGYITNMKVGISQDVTLGLIYAYRLKIGNGALRLGLSPSLRYFINDFSDPDLVATQGIDIDNALSREKETKLVANIGFGGYYHDKNLFIGVSVPRIVESDIDFDKVEALKSREARHIYAMAGYTIDINESYSFTPQVLMKYIVGAPMDLDFNIVTSFREKLYLGLTYRHYTGVLKGISESIDVLLGLQIGKPFYIGLSYDIGMNELAQYHNGSVEIAVRYLFIERGQKLEFDNPRYF